MSHSLQYVQAGDGLELRAPDATLTVKVDSQHTDGSYELFEVDAPRGDATPLHRTGWAKTYYMLQGRLVVRIDDEGFDLGPGTAIAIPPDALHTFIVLTPWAKFLVFSTTGAMGRFHSDLDASVVPGRPFEETMEDIQKVLGRHGVSIGVGKVPR